MIFDRVQRYCRLHNLTISEFEKLFGIGNGSVARWRVKQPSLKSLIKISKATRISLENWVNGADHE